MTTSTRYTHQKLASVLVILTLALSFVLPAYAQEAPVVDEETAYLSEEEQATEASQDGVTDFEAAHNTGCQPDFVIDSPTNGSSVTGIGLIWGRGFDAGHSGLGSGMDVYDLYRGDTFIATAAAGASRDPGHVRADLDAALGKADLRGGFIFRMDWSTQPGGNQTYRVLGRTGCEWVERTFTVNVNPAPPAPAASLSINDETRSASTGTSSGFGGQVCVAYFPGTSQCSQYSSSGTTGGQICVAYFPGTSQCSQYSSSGTTGAQVCVAYFPGTSQCSQYSSTGSTFGGTTFGNTFSDLNFDFNVTLSPATTQTVTVNYATADGSAVSPTDYASTSGTLTFAPGETSKTITVRVYSRGSFDSTDRDFFVRLTNPTNASISDGDGRGRIQRSFGTGFGTGFGSSGNCPFGQVWNGIQCILSGTTGFGGVNISDATCTESTVCTFPVTSTITTSTAITGTFTTTPGSALGGSACVAATPTIDYVSITGTWFIPAFSTTATISPAVTICGGDGAEAALETFTVSIAITSGNATVSDSFGTGTIPASAT